MNYKHVKESAGKVTIFSFVLVLFFSAGVFAQTPMQQAQQQQPVETDFDKAELEEFVDVYVASTQIQQGQEKVMIQAIEEEDLDVKRFNEILSVQQNQQSPEEINATAEEMAAFNKAAEKIMAVQQETQAEVQQLIESKIGGQKYQQIAMAYQQSPEVQEKVNKILQSKMGNKQ